MTTGNGTIGIDRLEWAHPSCQMGLSAVRTHDRAAGKGWRTSSPGKTTLIAGRRARKNPGRLSYLHRLLVARRFRRPDRPDRVLYFSPLKALTRHSEEFKTPLAKSVTSAPAGARHAHARSPHRSDVPAIHWP